MSFSPYNNNNNSSFAKFNPDNLKKKVRFVDTENKNFYCDTPGYWQFERKWNVIDNESNLLTPGVGTKTKAKIEMTQYLHPNNYEIPVANVVQRKEDNTTYFPGYDTGPGRGFGNLNVSNNIRTGDFTRTETKVYKAEKESEMLERWEFIDDRFTKPQNLVMEMPRGGDTTRKLQNDLTTINRMEDDKEFAFEYT